MASTLCLSLLFLAATATADGVATSATSSTSPPRTLHPATPPPPVTTPTPATLPHRITSPPQPITPSIPTTPPPPMTSPPKPVMPSTTATPPPPVTSTPATPPQPMTSPPKPVMPSTTATPPPPVTSTPATPPPPMTTPPQPITLSTLARPQSPSITSSPMILTSPMTSLPPSVTSPPPVTPPNTTMTSPTTTVATHRTTVATHKTTVPTHKTIVTSPKTTVVTTTADKFRQKCYAVVGCFNNSYPFNNDGLTLPDNPDHVGTEFRLFTRSTGSANYKVLTYNVSDSSVRDAQLNVSRRLRVIIHGFNNDINQDWMQDIMLAFLQVEDSNVMIVGWGPGANGMYEMAVANTRLVAKQIRLVLERLVNETGLDLKSVHLIGHSLGAHISGDVGRQLRSKVGRITAMDPAGPNFENYNNYVIVDKTDAMFVDTIHTNAKELIAGGAGMFTATGHVDFYVNGGRTQPGCKDGISAIFSGSSIGCSHARSHDVFLESITSECSFTGYPCLNQTYFQLGQCLDCEPGGCSELGLYADQYAARGPRYLNTRASAPYCGFHYSVTVHATSSTKGSIHVSLQGTWGTTGLMQITESNDQALTAKSDMVGVVVSATEVGLIQSMTIRYQKYAGTFGWSWLGGGSNTLSIAAVDVLSGESGRTVRFCVPGVLTHAQDMTIPASTTGSCK